MVRCTYKRAYIDNLYIAKFAGLSTDEKPTGNFVNGTKYVCVDTGAEFMWNETAKEWNQTKAGYTSPAESTPAESTPEET